MRAMRVAVAVLALFCGFALGMPDVVALDIGTATHHGPSRAAFASRIGLMLRAFAGAAGPKSICSAACSTSSRLAWTIWP